MFFATLVAQYTMHYDNLCKITLFSRAKKIKIRGSKNKMVFCNAFILTSDLKEMCWGNDTNKKPDHNLYTKSS